MASSGQPVSYRSNVNRAITKRWAEAKQISYEGNDWGDEDDDYYEPTPTSARSGQQPQYSGGPTSAASARRYPPPVQSNVGPRSITNPSPTRNMGRSSFDRGDDQRNLAHIPTRSFEGPYPNARPAPFAEPQHDFEQPQYERQARPLYGHPPLHVETGSRPSSRDQAYGRGQPFMGDTRGPHRDPRDSPSFVGMEQTGRRSQSSGRPSQADMLGRSDSPYRTVNHPPPARSQASRDASPTKRFPPRKSSMGQDTPVYNPPPQSESETTPTGSATQVSTADAKPLPFIRPADIYKRVAEEREKERRSQDSARPSIDSNASRPRDIFTSARHSQEDARPINDTASGRPRDSNAIAPGNSSRLDGLLPQSSGILASSASADTDPASRQRPSLDPVAERKSEYGFDQLLKGAGQEHPPSATPAASTMQPQPEPPSATSMTSGADPTTAMSDTSNYSNRPDPITASSVSSQQSIPHFLPTFRGVSDLGTDFINRGTPGSPNEVQPSYLPAKPQERSAEGLTRPQQPQPPFRGQDSSLAVPDSADAFNDQVGVSATPTSREAGDDPESLHHNPSIGLRSVVHQAFDDSQSQVPPTPSSVGDSLNRSNSASASDISPIITRDADASLGARPAQASGFAPIAEESRSVSRPGSSSLAESSDVRDVSHDIAEAPLPAPIPPFKPGYRRDSRTPSPGNSPAHNTMTVENSDIPKAALATISTDTPKVASKSWDTPRSTTDDWRDWEAQRRAFNAKAGFNDSTPTTPALTPGPRNDSPGRGMVGARQDSPSRGLVRDMANKLESRSGRVSPATSADPSPDTPRPSNARLESFRPTLPGGWQSYTTNTDALTPRQEFAAPPTSAERDAAVSQPPVMEPHDFSVATHHGDDEEGPKAGPPRFRREESDYGPSQAAFAAAAAAGSALLGAFSGSTNPTHRQDESPSSHDVSKDELATTPSVAAENVGTRDFGNGHDHGPLAPALAGIGEDREVRDGTHESHEQGPLAPVLANVAEDNHTATSAPVTPTDAPRSLGDTSHQHEGALAPTLAGVHEERHNTSHFARTPPAKDTPNESETDAPASTLGYFPPPLRTSRTNELSSPTRPTMLPALSTDMSPQDTENDRLRKEIVKSLTPKTSRQEELYKDEPLRSDEPLPRSTDGRLNEGDDAELSSTDVLEDYLPPDDEQHSVPAPKVSEPQHRPALEQRFSWERSEVASPQDPQSVQSASATQVMSGSPNTVRPTSQSSPRSAREQPLSLSSQAVPSVTTSDTIRRVQNDLSEDAAPLETSHMNSNGLGLRTTPSRVARETPFREILAMGSAQDRIQAYNSNRVLLANQDNGLQTWMQNMGEQTPEHTNTLRSNGRMTAHEAEALASFKPSPARSKFQRLASIGNTNPSLGSMNQSVDFDHDASPASNRSANPQGKKLLQTAGKLGGQAGVAAKGLFAKGKDKLRSSAGGNDKGIPTNRRNSRQLLTPTEERRHSSLAEPAPQIPNLNISAASPVREDDPWSLSSLANQRTAQQPLDHKQVQQLPLSSSQAGKDLLGQLQGPNEQGVLPGRRPSSRVSAVDSARDMDVPSRSISEVTRPTNSGDENSPTVARAQDRESADRGQAALNAVPAPRPPSTSLAPNAPVSDALGPVPTAAPDENQGTAVKVPLPPPAERALMPDHDLTPKQSDSREHQLGTLAVAPNTTRSIRESMQSVISSPSPGLPSDGAVPTLDDIHRRSVSPVKQEPIEPSVSDTASSPFENVAPVYSSKEAELAAERQQVDSTEEGLPAYPRPSEERKRAAARQSIDPASVVPVADLSTQKRNRTEPAGSRPFSFVGGETLISPLTKASTDRSAQSPVASSSLPGFDPLQKELSIVSPESSRDSLDLAKRKSKSYSRPFATDPNVRNHPAFRPSEEITREQASQSQVEAAAGQVNDIPPEQIQQRKAPAVNQPEGYRIPGPHGHQYRSPKQVPLAFAGQARPRSQSPYSQSEAPGNQSVHPLRSHDPQDVDRIQSPAGLGSASPAPQQQRLPPADRPEARSMSSLFRSRSRSGSRRGRGEGTGDVQPSPKKEKRGGIFRQRAKPDSESLRSDTGSFRRDSYGRADSPQQDFGGRQGLNGEERDHVGDINNTRPPSQLRNSSSGDILQSDGKKKRFSGFGGFFGRSGSASRDHGQQIESPGYGGVEAYREPKKQKQTEKPARASTFSGLLGKSNQARPQQGAVPPQNAPSQHGFPPQQIQAPFPPTNSMQHPYSPPPQRDYQTTQSFTAPAGMQRSPASIMPHDPDSFAREQYARGQDFLDQRHMQQNGYVAHPPQNQPDTGRQALHIDTGGNYAPAHHLVTAPPGSAPGFRSQSPSAAPPSAPPRQPSYFNNQRSQSPYEDTRSRSPYAANAANIPKSHATDLHKRSRSPRNGRRNSEEERDEMARANDPASQLGTFSKASAPRSADPNNVEQEKPWEIVLPGSEEKKRLGDARVLERAGSTQHSGTNEATPLARAGSTQQSATNGASVSTSASKATQNTTMTSEVKEPPRKQPTVAEKLMGVQTPREREPLKAAENQQRGLVLGASPVELPGSRAPGDESDEEIVMSSTAYPGQEWMPDNFGYGHWDE